MRNRKKLPVSIRTCSGCSRKRPLRKGRNFCMTCVINKRRKKMEDAIYEIVGNHCWICNYGGSDKRRMLDFHHVRKKEFNMNMTSAGWRATNVILKELKKCVLLCCRCHREVDTALISKTHILKLYREFWSKCKNIQLIYIAEKRLSIRLIDTIPKDVATIGIEKTAKKRKASVKTIYTWYSRLTNSSIRKDRQRGVLPPARKKKVHLCKNCNNPLSIKCKTMLCYSCYMKISFPNRKQKRISKEKLQVLVWKEPTVKVAARFGVSDKAVEKWCKNFGIKKPPRGYWAQHGRVPYCDVA